MQNDEKFGKLVHSLRIGNGLSLRSLADKAEISHSYLSQIELGKRNVPSPEIIKRLALALEFDYFTLARVAGYLDADGKVDSPDVFYQGSDYLSKEKINTIEFTMPGAFKEDLGDGHEKFTYISPEESKRWFLDLNYLLKTDEEIYFKQKILNDKEKKKIISMLEILIEDN